MDLALYKINIIIIINIIRTLIHGFEHIHNIDDIKLEAR